MGKLTEIEGHHQQMGGPSIQTLSPLLCHLANCWSLAGLAPLWPRFLCKRIVLLRWWIPRWGAAWPFHTGHNCLASHLSSCLQPVSALLLLQFKVNVPLLATEIFWNREDHNVRKSLILSDIYDLVSSTFHICLSMNHWYWFVSKQNWPKEERGPSQTKLPPPPSRSFSNVWTLSSLHTYLHFFSRMQ